MDNHTQIGGQIAEPQGKTLFIAIFLEWFVPPPRLETAQIIHVL